MVIIKGHPKDCNADSHLKAGRIQGHPMGHSADKASESEVPCFAFPVRLFGFVFALFHVFARILVRLRYALHNQSEILKAKVVQQLVDNKKNLMVHKMLGQNNNPQTNHNLQKLREELKYSNVSFSVPFFAIIGDGGYFCGEAIPIAVFKYKS